MLATLAPVAAALESATPRDSFHVPEWLWISFLVGVAALLLFDLLVLNKEAHEITVREAAWSSAGWIAIGLAFGAMLPFVLDDGGTASARYLTGYIVEKSLSVDNVFVWAVIFRFFGVPSRFQHRVLFWGIFGALAMRAAFIFAGAALLDAFEWMMWVFGAILLYTAVNVYRDDGEDEIDPEANPALRIVRRFVPVSEHYDGQKLWTREHGKLIATPLFIVLVAIEMTDLLFAVDSVPAILSISSDRFILYSSNAMAILGLRSLYFLLEAVRERLVYLPKGLGVILFYVGVKMLISRWVHVDPFLSLGVIAAVLAVTISLSLRATRTTAGM